MDESKIVLHIYIWFDLQKNCFKSTFFTYLADCNFEHKITFLSPF